MGDQRESTLNEGDGDINPLALSPSFGLFEPFGLADNVDYIREYGPNGKGFISIHLYAFACCDPQYIETATSESYSYRMARLERSEISSDNWSAVRKRVEFCLEAGANVFYVDDAFSIGDITKAQIDSVASIVHSKGALLATGEYDESRMATIEGIGIVMWISSCHISIITPPRNLILFFHLLPRHTPRS